ncbi:MAG: helix-turn-helix domain-containing protein [Planctomycetaceae bacterium]|nr:helix-turn-helix domain-containing protein [Planctomycetaceae bacterium]
MSESNELFLTAEQCAKRYNISERHFRKLVDNGIMPKPMKLGRCSRWIRRVLEEYESKQAQKLMRPLNKTVSS